MFTQILIDTCLAMHVIFLSVVRVKVDCIVSAIVPFIHWLRFHARLRQHMFNTTCTTSMYDIWYFSTRECWPMQQLTKEERVLCRKMKDLT